MSEVLSDVDRLLERYAAGERVRAVRTIVDASSGLEVPEDARGVVQDPRVRGVTALVSVFWPALRKGCVTSAENLEPIDRAPNLGAP